VFTFRFGSGFEVLGSGFKVLGSGFEVLGSGFEVLGSALLSRSDPSFSGSPGVSQGFRGLQVLHQAGDFLQGSLRQRIEFFVRRGVDVFLVDQVNQVIL
jgi:hypothetical protein